MSKTQMIVDFVATARANGITNLWAHLPSSHPLVQGNVVSQIRKVKDCLAMGFDELGNRVRLTTDCFVVQDL